MSPKWRAFLRGFASLTIWPAPLTAPQMADAEAIASDWRSVLDPRPDCALAAEAEGWTEVMPFEAWGIYDRENWVGEDPHGEYGFIPRRPYCWHCPPEGGE